MSTNGPLAGLHVIEMEAIGPVPHCGLVLLDLGADVLRIERPTASGLGIRTEPRFDVLASGKRRQIVDLKRPEGVVAVLDLLAGADAILEGFRPGTMERLGLGPEVCLARNPRLVYGRMSGWGDAGPMRDLAGHDLNYLGLTGALAAMGTQGQPPPVPLNLIGDFGGAAMQLATGVLAALLQARASGEGQVVVTSILEGAHALTPFLHGLRAGGAWADRRGANVLDGGAPFYRCYGTADPDRYVAVAAIEPPFFRTLIQRLDLLDTIDPAAQMDRTTWPATADRLAACFRTRGRDEWAAHFAGTDGCVTPVLEWNEAVADPQAAALGVFERFDGVARPRTAARFAALNRSPIHEAPGQRNEGDGRWMQSRR